MLGIQGKQNPAIMKPEEHECPLQKEDRDSGLDNSSDSGHSCDDEPSQTSSDTDEFVKSEENIHILEPAEFHHHIDIITCPHWPEEESKLDSIKISSDEIVMPCDMKEAAVLDVDSLTEPNNNNNAVNSNASLEDYPEYYRNLYLKGTNEPVDFAVKADQKPEWLDTEKFKRGQKFALDNLFGINFAESSALFMIFSMKYGLAPLIFTGMSDTPFKCFKRYLSTALRVRSWYEDDVWNNESNTGKANLSIVRGMHKNVHMKISSSTPEEFERKGTIWNKAEWSSNFPLREIVEDDFKGSCPMSAYPDFLKVKPNVIVSQTAMALTQFSFVGLVVTYPKQFGMHYATDEDLDAFLHVWRGIGYLLGIKDQFNFCNADLATVRKRTIDLIDLVIKPSLREVSADWEHMSRSLVDGVGFYIKSFYFESALMYVCDVLNIHTPRLKKYVSFKFYFVYLMVKFTYNYLCRIPSVFKWLNERVSKNVQLASEASPETLKKWEAKEFSYLPKNKNL